MNTIGLAMAAAYLLAVTKRNFVHVMCGFARGALRNSRSTFPCV